MPLHNWTRADDGMYHDFHQSWSIYIKNTLNAGILPSGTFALVESRAGTVEADVLTLDTDDGDADWSSRGGSATLTRPYARFVQKSDKEWYAERANRILVQRPLGHTIAVIEIVSSGNKHSNREFKRFVEKSQGYIASGIHLLIVDPFPPSKRDPFGVHRAIWDDFDDEPPVFEFPAGKDRLAVSYETEDGEKVAYVEPFSVGDSLPDMPLFLGRGYHVTVPLESTYQTTWSFIPVPLQQKILAGTV